MLISQPLPFIRAYLDMLDEQWRVLDRAGRGLSRVQRQWLGFCLMGILITGSLGWARLERAGLQSLVMLLRVSESVTIPIDFRFYQPDPVYRPWRRQDQRLRRQGVSKAQRPPAPAFDPRYPSQAEWPWRGWPGFTVSLCRCGSGVWSSMRSTAAARFSIGPAPCSTACRSRSTTP